MSTFADRRVPCRQCDHEMQGLVATSINVTRTPAWRTAILDGSFQRWTCPACAAVTVPLEPFPYIDFDRRQLIGVFPTAVATRWWDVEGEVAGAHLRNLGADGPEVARPIGEGMDLRAVFGLAALREKLVLFDAGLDDAVLEALKLRLLLAADGLGPDDRLRLVEVDGAELVFDVPRSSGEAAALMGRLVVDRSEYDGVASDPHLRDSVIAGLASGEYRDVGRLLHPAPAPAH